MLYKLMNIVGYPIYVDRLTFAGLQLKDGRKLIDYNIKNFDVLEVSSFDGSSPKVQ